MANLSSGEAIAHFDEASPVLSANEVAVMPKLWDEGEFVESHFDIVGKVVIPPSMARDLDALVRWEDQYQPTGTGVMEAEREGRILGSQAVQDLNGRFQDIRRRDLERSGIVDCDTGVRMAQIWAGNHWEPKGWHFDITDYESWIRHGTAQGTQGPRGVRHRFRRTDGLGALHLTSYPIPGVELLHNDCIVQAGELAVARFTPFTLHAACQKRAIGHNNRLFLASSAPVAVDNSDTML